MKLSQLIASETYDDGSSPTDWALFRETVDPEVVARLSIPGEPASKSRPRFTGQNRKARAYTPEATRQAEEIIGWHFRKACPAWRAPDPTGHFGVFAKFFAATQQRRDVDNMLKLVLDACNNLVWADDVQVSEVSGRVLRGVAEPRTEIIIYQTWRFLGEAERANRELTCEHCGNNYQIPRSQTPRRYCSLTCANMARWNSRKKSCPECGNEFLESPAQPKEFCSPACRARAVIVDLLCTGCGKAFTRPRSMVRRRVNAFCDTACHAEYWRKRRLIRAAGTCSICGGPTSKKSYQRCKSCKLAGAVMLEASGQ